MRFHPGPPLFACGDLLGIALFLVQIPPRRCATQRLAHLLETCITMNRIAPLITLLALAAGCAEKPRRGTPPPRPERHQMRPPQANGKRWRRPDAASSPSRTACSSRSNLSPNRRPSCSARSNTRPPSAIWRPISRPIPGTARSTRRSSGSRAAIATRSAKSGSPAPEK